jgi:hypothetical protein
MRSDPIDGSIFLSGGGGFAARGFFRVGFGLVGGLAGHRFHLSSETAGFGLWLSGFGLWLS